MATDGPSGRTSLGPRSFDFGSEDVLCSYDDFASNNNNQEPSVGNRSDPSAKDYHERKIRPLVNIYGQQDEYPKEEVIAAVEKCMKKYADNLLRHLEGISGRLSQLEVYSFKLERSIGELQADMIHDHSDKDTKFNSLEKHLQEVHRSIQILRDKQELTETQKELSKLQFASSKESANPPRTQKNEENAPSSLSEPEGHHDATEIPNQHLALALPHQIAAMPPPPTRVPDHSQLSMQQQQQQQQQQPTPPSLSMQQGHYMLNQTPPYYPQQSQTLQSAQHYMQARPQTLDPSVQAPPATQQQPPVVNQTQPQQPFPYQQQWPQPSSQQFTQQVAMVTQPPTSRGQLVRSRTPPTYSYPPQQSANPETFSYAEPVVPFGYGPSGATISIQSQPQQQASSQTSFGPLPPSKAQSGYLSMSPYPPETNIQGYSTVYGMDGNRVLNYQPESYPAPSIVPGTQNLQQLPPSGTGGFPQPGSQMIPSHPYADIIEKALSMGYPRDQVVSVINRMGDNREVIDFNALLDRLNTHQAPVGPPRAWSG